MRCLEVGGLCIWEITRLGVWPAPSKTSKRKALSRWRSLRGLARGPAPAEMGSTPQTKVVFFPHSGQSWGTVQGSLRRQVFWHPVATGFAVTSDCRASVLRSA